FYELLNRYHIQVNQSKEYIEAILPDKEIQEVLNITEHEPILKRVRITKQLETDFREYSECYYIGNK
ncbi:UTRA domain-containing protein, partial [Enterococcus faecium]